MTVCGRKPIGPSKSMLGSAAVHAHADRDPIGQPTLTQHALMVSANCCLLERGVLGSKYRLHGSTAVVSFHSRESRMSCWLCQSKTSLYISERCQHARLPVNAACVLYSGGRCRKNNMYAITTADRAGHTLYNVHYLATFGQLIHYASPAKNVADRAVISPSSTAPVCRWYDHCTVVIPPTLGMFPCTWLLYHSSWEKGLDLFLPDSSLRGNTMAP